jgi:hypothetical protein
LLPETWPGCMLWK